MFSEENPKVFAENHIAEGFVIPTENFILVSRVYGMLVNCTRRICI